MPTDIKEVLDQCLDRISKGDSVESCLADHPAYAEDLAPMLTSAARLYSIQDVRPSEVAKARARSRLEHAIAVRTVKKQRDLIPQWALMFARPVGVALLAIVVLTSGAGATVAAASDSLPDGSLYQVKRTTESVRLALTFGDVQKARLHASYANRRAREMAVMATKQGFDGMEGLQSNLQNHLVNVQKIVATGSEVSLEGASQSDMSSMRVAEPENTSNSSNDMLSLRASLAAQGITSIARIEALIPTAPAEQQAVLRNMVKFMRETYSATLTASGSTIPKELQNSAE